VDPLERDELTDQELDALLPEWEAPKAPARLKAALFPERRSWWRRLWSLRVPLPAAVAATAALAAGVWLSSRTAPVVQVRTERVEVPVAMPAKPEPAPRNELKRVVRRRPPAARDGELRPVMRLKPIVLEATQ
jgi:hypothetical protein